MKVPVEKSVLERLPVSVSMIARNEAKNLPRSLGSVADWVNEIVVVVNDCTDDTVRIAESYGARVLEHPWTSYRDQKRFALEQVTQPWVLAIDADEEVSEAMRGAIREFLEKTSTGVDGVSFRRKVWFLGRWIAHGDWYPDWSLRFFRRGKGRWEGSPEHDKVLLKGIQIRIPLDLHHYSFPSINAQVLKIPVFASYFLQRQLEEGKKWCLAATLFRSGWRFFRAYVLRRGFLDGYPGLYIALATAFFTLVRYTQLYEFELQRRERSGL